MSVFFSEYMRVRGRKQKTLVVGLDKQLVNSRVRELIGLRYPGAYTGKGIRVRGYQFLLKKRKQQQRGK